MKVSCLRVWITEIPLSVLLEGPRWLVKKQLQTRGVCLASQSTCLPSPLGFELLRVRQYSEICLGHHLWKTGLGERLGCHTQELYTMSHQNPAFEDHLHKETGLLWQQVASRGWLYIKHMASLLLAHHLYSTLRFKHCHSRPKGVSTCPSISHSCYMHSKEHPAQNQGYQEAEGTRTWHRIWSDQALLRGEAHEVPPLAGDVGRAVILLQ